MSPLGVSSAYGTPVYCFLSKLLSAQKSAWHKAGFGTDEEG